MTAQGDSTVRRIMTEAMVSAAIVMIVALVMSPSAPGAGAAQPHLLWIAVLVLSAHYGVYGLIAALGTGVIALSLASISVGEDLGWLIERANSTSEILSFVGAVTVAWVVGGHVQRKRSISVVLATRCAEAVEAQVAFGELRTVADSIARRADRAQLSVSYLRSIAERIDHGEPNVSADAAIELALSRIDARVGAILLHDGTRLRLFAHRGVWSADRLLPPDVFQDQTSDHAFACASPTTSAALAAISELDSDVAVPILDNDGQRLGVLAVRGLSFDLQAASIERYDRTVCELLAIARWISRAIALAVPPPAAKPELADSFSFVPGEQRALLDARRLVIDVSGHAA